jgi:hypothetical protein
LKKIFSIILLFSAFTGLRSQYGGTAAYRFLDLPMPARAAGLGGTTMSIWGDDINLYFSNPAMLNASCAKQLALNYSNYVSDINYGNVAYGHHFNKIGTVAGGIQFFNYGKFDKRDEYDTEEGSFKAADYSFNLTIARRLKDTSFSYGVTLKTIYSHYDIYTAFGNAVDFGLAWQHKKSGFTAALVIKNVGKIWNPYTKNDTSTFQPTSQLGISYKVKKAPFRLMFVYNNLRKWDLTYASPLDEDNTKDPFASETEKEVEKTKWQNFQEKFGKGADKFARHMIFATEIVITKNFNLRVGYNYRLHKEMMLPEKRTASGLSLGFGLGINRFRFNYAFTKYNVAGNSHVFSLTTHLGAYVKTTKTQTPTEPEK